MRTTGRVLERVISIRQPRSGVERYSFLVAEIEWFSRIYFLLALYFADQQAKRRGALKYRVGGSAGVVGDKLAGRQDNVVEIWIPHLSGALGRYQEPPFLIEKQQAFSTISRKMGEEESLIQNE